MTDFSVADSHWTKWLRCSINGQSYAATHGEDDATSVPSSQTRFCAQTLQAANFYIIDRKPLYFDTSALGNDTIADARIIQHISFVAGRQKSVRIVDAPDLNDPPVVADYGYLHDLIISLGQLDSGDMVLDAENVWRLNTAGIAAINPGGMTKFAFRTIDDITGSPPTETVEGISLEDGASGPYLASILEIDFVATLLPTVITFNCTDTIAEKTTGHGSIISKGASEVTQHGHVWSTSFDPTTADSKTENGAAPNLGQFQSDITGLTPGTIYYVRAYATNNNGTAYGGNTTIIADTIIGRRYWWVERDEFHFWSEWGEEMKLKGTSVANDQDILAHLGE